MSEHDRYERVLVTGGTGFVGRYVVRALLERGHQVVCLVRSEQKFREAFGPAENVRLAAACGSLFDPAALGSAAEGADAVIHLVGIIRQGRGGLTFDRVHRQGTEGIVEAAVRAGVSRYVHMSALGTRLGAVSAYHRTKWAAEECVRTSGLDWTIFRPSVIHGPDGEFMQLVKVMACGLLPPVMPCFGSGRFRLQPVSVRDVAHCFTEALHRPETVGRVYELGGPANYTWRQFYDVCKRLIPGARRRKPVVGMPLPVAKLLAATIMKTPLVPAGLRFNRDQIQMSQEDSVCDHAPVESAFGFKLRDFERELATYASRIK
jgi:NADH dehydrogenase